MNITPVADPQEQEDAFLDRLDMTMSEIRILARDTFSLLAQQVNADGVGRAVDSAASTHATLGGNLATAAAGVAKAVESAASTHATLGGNVSTAAESVARAVDSAASTHATLGGNLATAAEGVARAVRSAPATAATNDSNAFVANEYVDYFRTLVLTMLGELPRKGHLIADFDEMFDINAEKKITPAEFHEMGELMRRVTDDWTSDEFLKSPPSMIVRMRETLLAIADILEVKEKIPSTFGKDDLEIAPHIALLNDFLSQLIARIDGKQATYQLGIEGNVNLLESAKTIVRNHRDSDAPLSFKILRTAVLENTAQARINGLRIVAANFGLGEHPYLTTHDIVEGFHGRDSLEQLRVFVRSSDTPIETLDGYLLDIKSEVTTFYAGMRHCVSA